MWFPGEDEQCDLDNWNMLSSPFFFYINRNQHFFLSLWCLHWWREKKFDIQTTAPDPWALSCGQKNEITDRRKSERPGLTLGWQGEKHRYLEGAGNGSAFSYVLERSQLRWWEHLPDVSLRRYDVSCLTRNHLGLLQEEQDVVAGEDTYAAFLRMSHT